MYDFVQFDDDRVEFVWDSFVRGISTVGTVFGWWVRAIGYSIGAYVGAAALFAVFFVPIIVLKPLPSLIRIFGGFAISGIILTLYGAAALKYRAREADSERAGEDVVTEDSDDGENSNKSDNQQKSGENHQ